MKPWMLPRDHPGWRAWYAIVEWVQDDPSEARTYPQFGEALHEHYPRLMAIVQRQIEDAERKATERAAERYVTLEKQR